MEEEEKIIKKAHNAITRIKGKEYAPTSYELQEWIDLYKISLNVAKVRPKLKSK